MPATPAITFTVASDHKQRLETIGLGGDGDEVDAIQAVERHFGVTLEHIDAPNWWTAGDVFDSLLRVLPPDQYQRDDVWPIFAAIMCDETGADASRIGPDTLLLALPMRVVVRRWLDRVFSSRT